MPSIQSPFSYHEFAEAAEALYPWGEGRRPFFSTFNRGRLLCSGVKEGWLGMPPLLKQKKTEEKVFWFGEQQPTSSQSASTYLELSSDGSCLFKKSFEMYFKNVYQFLLAWLMDF